MIFGLFRGRRNARVIERLHAEIVAAARDPVLFTDYGIADTIDGRFESIALHAALALRRLKQLPAPGPEIAQDLADAIFRHFDVGLREMGVGDIGVPRRMRDLAEAFFGRANAYNERSRSRTRRGMRRLPRLLSRNVFGDARDGAQLRATSRRSDEALAQMTLAEILKGPIFPVEAAANIPRGAVMSKDRSYAPPPKIFSHSVLVDEVPEQGLDVTLSADAPTRQALAKADGLVGIAALEADFHVARQGLSQLQCHRHRAGEDHPDLRPDAGSLSIAML